MEPTARGAPEFNTNGSFFSFHQESRVGWGIFLDHGGSVLLWFARERGGFIPTCSAKMKEHKETTKLIVASFRALIHSFRFDSNYFIVIK